MLPGAPRERLAGDRLGGGLGNELKARDVRVGDDREPSGGLRPRRPAVGDEAAEGLDGEDLRKSVGGVLPVDPKPARIGGGDFGVRLDRLGDGLGERPLQGDHRPSFPAGLHLRIQKRLDAVEERPRQPVGDEGVAAAVAAERLHPFMRRHPVLVDDGRKPEGPEGRIDVRLRRQEPRDAEYSRPYSWPRALYRTA